MYRQRIFNLIVLLSLMLTSVVGPVRAATPVDAARLVQQAAHLQADAWMQANTSTLMAGWAEQQILVVRNLATSQMPVDYTVRYAFDTAALIAAEQMQADCGDLRVTFGEGMTEVEIDRMVEGCNTTATVVWFRTQAGIDINGSDAHYSLYYGNLLAGAAPANPANIYAFSDNFTDANADGWITSKGTWAVIDDGGNFIFRYTGGGPNWSIAYFPAPDMANLEYTAKMRAAANTNWIGLAYRIQDANNFLTFYQSRDTSQFKNARIASDDHTIQMSPAFSMAADVWYSIRVQAVGSQVRSRIWPAGETEPSTWNIQASESTFQTQGNFGLTLYNHSTTADWDDIQVRKLVDMEPVVEKYQPPSSTITSWAYRAPINVTNGAAEALPVRYSSMVMVDTTSLIAMQKMRADCSDLRVGSMENGNAYEIDRIVEGCNTASTQVWFALRRPVAPGGSDSGYYLYYGDTEPVTALANADNVFLFFEDWEKGSAHWTNAAGLDPANTGTLGFSEISSNFSISPANSQRFPQKLSGGDAFSGYIPVSPGTSYAISAWARADENTYVPLGFDPYTAAYGKGTEVWLWVNNWTVGQNWAWRSGRFTTASDAAYLKIKSEWWSEAPGTQPVYMDNIAMRAAASVEPTLSLGDEETTLVVPTIEDITTNSPVNLGAALDVYAQIDTTEDLIDGATLRIVSPAAVDVQMSLISGTSTSGVWQGSTIPTQGGDLTFRILARSSQNRVRVSTLQTIHILDSQPPSITQLSFTNPLRLRGTQTVTANVTDNGSVSAVNINIGGTLHPMVAVGSQYSYAWRVTTAETVNFTITAVDSAGNQSQQPGSFSVAVNDVDVCTWKDCKVGAESWSIDDGVNTCKADLEAAGIRGTYYYNGSTPQSWFADYSNAGHEVSSHTVGHLCYTPGCSPNCTQESLAQIPYTEAEVTEYRLNQLEPNIAAIEASTNKPVLSLAWPCGCVDPGREKAASYYYLGARGYYDYIAELKWVQDVNPPDVEDFYLLLSGNSYNQTYIDRAEAEGKWAIIVSHSSCEGIPYMGTKKDVLWAATVGDVLQYIKVRDNAQFSGYTRSGRTISFQAAHTLNTFERQKLDGSYFLPITLDQPVSLKVHILDSDNVAGIEVDGSSVPYTIKTIDGVRFIVFDAALNTTRQVIVHLAAPAPTIEPVSDNSPVEIGQTAHVEAVVSVSEGSVQNVTLQVLTPQAAEYPMTPVFGKPDTYASSFTPTQLSDYTYRIVAANDTAGSTQTAVRTLRVQDTTEPAMRAQNQSSNSIQPGGSITLSAEGQDAGGLAWATLETNESGEWQQYTFTASDWWNHDWARRVSLTLTETQDLARTAETVDVAISADQFSGLSSCAELRAADAGRNELPVQIYGETGSGETLSCHLLFQTAIGAGETKDIYIYYGNANPAPASYTSDLTSSALGGTITVQNSYFDLDLDSISGVISRLRLLHGSSSNLSLSPRSDSYWGWHQVCSTLDGNITGKNNQCVSGSAEASGVSVVTTLDGPLVKEYTLTSVKNAAVYTIVYRFYANSPYYSYRLSRTGTNANVMNNFWYANGNFGRLNSGTDGASAYTYNGYNANNDLLRIVSLAGATPVAIDGMNNDGTSLGGTDYQHPNAAGLDLLVATALDPAGLQNEIARVASPVHSQLGVVENVPATQYGSPIRLDGATSWAQAAFTWQNPAISAGRNVQWRVKICDAAENCASTPAMTFYIAMANTAPNAVADSYITNKDTVLTVAAPGVLGNDSDADGNPLTATLVAGPAHGTLALQPSGAFTYTPASGYFGMDAFTYRANDGTTDSPTASVQIRVNSSSLPPVLPSSFYGTLYYDAQPPAPGTLLQVRVAGISTPIATAALQQSGANLVYQLDVPGDALDTALKEGGVEGEALTFSIDGRVVAHAVWRTGANTRVDVHAVTLDLQSGWNLISFELQPAEPAIAAVLASMDGKYDLVYAWDGASQSWLKYDNVPLSSDSLERLDEKMGVWVHVTEAAVELQVVGSLPSTTAIGLVVGWNLVGYPSGTAGSVPASFPLVYAYHAADAGDPWKMYDRQSPAYVNDLSQLTPGWGYWVQAESASTWQVSYSTP